MSEKYIHIVASDGSVLLQRLVDNGDGTHSPSIYAVIEGSSGSPVSAWAAAGHRVSADGDLLAERETRSDDVRWRSYTKTTDALGNVTFTAGPWIDGEWEWA